MNRHRLRAILAATIAGGTLAATAFAAEPDKGTISAEAPKVTWKGSVSDGPYLSYTAFRNEGAAGQDGRFPCGQGCDRFTLTVAKQGDVTLGADAASGFVALRVKKPDGSYVTTSGEASEGKPLTVKFKGAPTGEYVIDYANNNCCASEYTGFAQLGSGAAAATPGQQPSSNPPPPSPTPIPNSGQQGQPVTPGTGPVTGSGQGENIDLKINAGKVSARKLKKSRKLKVTVTVSREVAKLRGFLRKGRKTVGKATRGKTSGQVKVTLKLSKKAVRKLKKGTFRLTFVADDAKGTTASKTVKLTVRK